LCNKYNEFTEAVVTRCSIVLLVSNYDIPTYHRLLVFERKILRKIFVPSRNYNGSWRTKTNEESDNLIKARNIVIFIKAQRISLLGHISRM
jgi:hypothetical protein